MSRIVSRQNGIGDTPAFDAVAEDRRTMSEQITVVVVDTEPGAAEHTAKMLERERESIVAHAVRTAEEALETWAATDIDCLVSGCSMSEATGIELFERICEESTVPFVLLTEDGSEELASEAIAAGVTRYVQSDVDEEPYTVLAAQVVNTVAGSRAEAERRERSRRHERTLTALHETTQELLRAETKDEIYRTATETAVELLGGQIAAAYAYRPTSGVLEHVASAQSAPALGDPEATVARNEGALWEVFAAGEPSYYENLQSVKFADMVEPPSRSAQIVPLGAHGVFLVGSETVDGVDETTREVVQILAANTEAALDRAEREQLLREHDRSLTRQNEALTRLNHLNEIVREISHGIAQATTRETVEKLVCETLADTGRYRFAWITPAEADSPEPTSWAGVDASYVDRIRDGTERSPESVLVRRSLDSGRVQIVENVLEATDWDGRRTEALTYGFQTVVSIPLVAEGRRYGVLAVYVAGVDAIDNGEREVLAELGETIGNGIQAIERRRVTASDDPLELELECRDDRLIWNRLAERVGEPVSVIGTLDRGEAEVTAFVSVPATADLDGLESEWAAIDRLTVIAERDDELLCELSMAVTPFLEVLRAYDVRIRAASASGEATRLTLAVPRGVETRPLIEAIQERLPHTALEARRETTGTTPVRGLDAHLEAELTERQFQALQAAYYSGFFEWPRESTAETLADVFDLSPPTYHYHLRAAERKLVTLVFEETLGE
jgi:HTH-type transcriptional regulator, bacterioopsin transcriptional activator and related proteins